MKNQQPADVETQENIDELLEKYDVESTYRLNLGRWQWVVLFLGASLTVFHLYTAFTRTLPSQLQGAIHLGTALGLIFLLFPAKRSWRRTQKTVPWYDVVLAFTALYVTYHKIFFYEEVLLSRIHGYSVLEVIISIVGILLLLEATRRTVGIPIVVVASIMMLYAIFGNFIPTQILSHPGFSVDRLTTNLWFQESGVFGTPIQISSKIIYLFLFFGVMLVHSKIGQFFNDLAFSLTGRFTGGTAKTAVIASALQGTVSGSSVANTVGSGAFTIPMMKRSGFKPEFAAATEASASTGGQIMPPLMGAAAFIMMDYLGVEFSVIMIAAVIPAILYFSGIFIGTHFEAKKLGILGLPKSQLPDLKKLLLKYGYMLLPIIIIIVIILQGFTPQRAALMGTITAFIITMIRKETRMGLMKFLKVLEEGARVALPVIAACATAGIIAGVVSITGLGSKFAAAVLTLSAGFLPIALFLTMIACLILGMGMPTTANYVVTATIAAPVLISEFGVLPIAAHMFVFYFGIVADITPPVSLAAYAGAGLAKANPFKTGVNAVKLAIAAFIIPYIFVYDPILLLQMQEGNALDLLISLTTAVIGMTAVSAAVIGHFVGKTYAFERIILFIAGLLLIIPEILQSTIGILILIAIYYLQKRREKKDLDSKPGLQA